MFALRRWMLIRHLSHKHDFSFPRTVGHKPTVYAGSTPSKGVWTRWDLNPELSPCKGDALPLSYEPQLFSTVFLRAWAFRLCHEPASTCQIEVDAQGASCVSFFYLPFPRKVRVWYPEKTSPVMGGVIRYWLLRKPY